MNDDDRKLAAWIAFCCAAGIVAVLLVTAGIRLANAAALLEMDGTRIVVMTADEFNAALAIETADKEKQIEALKRELAAERSLKCIPRSDRPKSMT